MEKLMKLRAILLVVLVVGMVSADKCSATFKDCYTKCFIFCMIEPSETLCSCTTHCLKDCIFQDIPRPTQVLHDHDHHRDNDNLGFCKLGCAFSMCSTISTERTPNGEIVDGCVGSCSNKCTKSY